MERKEDNETIANYSFHIDRGLLENAGTIVGQRSLQWDLGIIQPGLCLRVGPTVDSNSILEFVMDPNKDRGDRYLMEEPSTGNSRKLFLFIFFYCRQIKFLLFKSSKIHVEISLDESCWKISNSSNCVIVWLNVCISFIFLFVLFRFAFFFCCWFSTNFNQTVRCTIFAWYQI